MRSSEISRRRFSAAMLSGGVMLQCWQSLQADTLGSDGQSSFGAEGAEVLNGSSPSGNALDLFSPEALKYHIEYGEHARELIKGALDLHVHSSPDCFVRIFTHDELALHALQYGIGGVLLKAHCQGTADRVPFVKKLISGIDVFGSITLNNAVGGLNPSAVEAAIEYGAKAVWLPSMDAQHHVNHYGKIGTYGSELPLAWERRAVSQPINVLDNDGRLKKEMHEILELISSANIILNIGGHVSYEEMLEVLRAARALKITKNVVEHPMHPVTNMPLDRQRELISKGAIINYVSSDLYWDEAPASPMVFAESIKELGAENIVLSSDGGAIGLPPYEMLLGSVQLLIDHQVRDSDIQLMIRYKPWELVS